MCVRYNQQPNRNDPCYRAIAHLNKSLHRNSCVRSLTQALKPGVLIPARDHSQAVGYKLLFSASWSAGFTLFKTLTKLLLRLCPTPNPVWGIYEIISAGRHRDLGQVTRNG